MFVHVVGHMVVYVEISQPSLPHAHVPNHCSGVDPDDERNVLDGFSDYFKLHTLDAYVDNNPLVGSIHKRRRIVNISHGGASQV